MDQFIIQEQIGTPFTERKLVELKEFLAQQGLKYEEQIEYSYVLRNEEGEIIATGSLHKDTLKCIAVATEYQGYGILAKIMTNLMSTALQSGKEHLFLFTKPKNKIMFQEYGFYQIVETEEVLLMENQKKGIETYLHNIKNELRKVGQQEKGSIGAIVMNANPFTNGHRYLIEQARKQCQYLIVFVVSSDESMVPAEERFRLVREGTKDLENLIIVQTNQYLVSIATFPSYFIKEKERVPEINCELDIKIFGEKIAPALGISKRFVGTEPNCIVTKRYNVQMKEQLKQYEVDLIEIERKCKGNDVISASIVRKMALEQQWERIREYVPAPTFEYLYNRFKK